MIFTNLRSLFTILTNGVEKLKFIFYNEEKITLEEYYGTALSAL